MVRKNTKKSTVIHLYTFGPDTFANLGSNSAELTRDSCMDVARVELKCAILTDCVNIPNVTIVIHPDATIGCVKNYLLAAIRSSGHQFEMKDFDDLMIALRNDESDLSMSWPARHDYTRITQTAAFKKSRKVLGDHWEVSLLFCMKSNLEAKEQERRICRIRTPSPEEAPSGFLLRPPGRFLTVDGMLTHLRERWNPETNTLIEWKTHIFRNDDYHAALRGYTRIGAMMEKLARMGFQSIQDKQSQKKKPQKMCNRRYTCRDTVGLATKSGDETCGWSKHA